MDDLYGDIDDFHLFADGLRKLKPVLQQLIQVTRIVWMIQSPGPVFVISSTEHDFGFAAKIPGYNLIVREILG